MTIKSALLRHMDDGILLHFIIDHKITGSAIIAPHLIVVVLILEGLIYINRIVSR